MGKLNGRAAVVTGAGRGIGRAIALKLAGEGARLVINDLDDEPLQQTAGLIRDGGGTVATLAGDVAAADFGERLIGASLDAHGDCHVLVNNAGYIWNTTIQNNSDEQWYAMIDVHATGPFRVLRAAAAHFREVAKRESPLACRKVVNISSVSGYYGAATQVSYAAGKAAIVGITKSLAKEWGRYNVTVNCVAFGYIDTRLTQTLDDGPRAIDVHGRQHKVGLSPEYRDEAIRSTPLGRPGTPEEAAGGVYLFCIPESDFISGQILIVGGGRTG